MIGDTNYGTLGFRGASLASLTAENPVLAAFEPVIATDGLDFVFKVGDGVRAWNDLPALNGTGGGGGGTGAVEAWAYANPLVADISTISGGMKLTPDNWAFTNYVGDLGGVGGVDQFGWGYEQEGWYQIKFNIAAGFTAGALALPEALYLDLMTWEGMTMQHEFQCGPAAGVSIAGGNKSMYGVLGTVTSQPYWSPDASVTPVELQSAHQLDLRWKGDATISRANTGAATGVVTMEIVRLTGIANP